MFNQNEPVTGGPRGWVRNEARCTMWERVFLAAIKEALAQPSGGPSSLSAESIAQFADVCCAEWDKRWLKPPKPQVDVTYAAGKDERDRVEAVTRRTA
jgi:hypothetical protein